MFIVGKHELSKFETEDNSCKISQQAQQRELTHLLQSSKMYLCIVRPRKTAETPRIRIFRRDSDRVPLEYRYTKLHNIYINISLKNDTFIPGLDGTMYSTA
jgi:hypothetical protein